MLIVRLLPAWAGPACLSGHGWDLPVSVQRTSPRAWGLRQREVPHPQAISGEDVAFSSAERDRHLEIRPVSPLDTQPMVTPVNAW